MTHLYDESREHYETDERLQIKGVGIGGDYATAPGYDGKLPDGTPFEVDDDGKVTLFPLRARDVNLPDMGHAPDTIVRNDTACRPSVIVGNGQLYAGPGILMSIAVWNEATPQVTYRLSLRDRNQNGTRIFCALVTDSSYFILPAVGLVHDGLYAEFLNLDYTPMTVSNTVRTSALGLQNNVGAF